MAALTCYAKKCTYNEDCKCCKGDIMVGGKHANSSEETCCESFRDAKSDQFSSALEHPCQTISIDCEVVNCKYNSNYKCHADSVQIDGESAMKAKETACGTFYEK